MTNTDSVATTSPGAHALGMQNSRGNLNARSDSTDEASNSNEAASVKLTQHSQELRVTQVRSAEHLSGLAEELSEAIQLLNESLARAPTKASISHDDELNRFVVRIADKESGEVVREIPSEDLLNFARYLDKLRGILFDKKV